MQFLESHFQAARLKPLLLVSCAPHLLELLRVAPGWAHLLRVTLSRGKALLTNSAPVAVLRVVVGIDVQANLEAAAVVAKDSPAPPAVGSIAKEIPRE